MRIYGPSGTPLTSATKSTRRVTSGGFTLEESESSQAPAGTGGPRAVGSIDALLALQGIEDPVERRRRAVKRGRVALDALDELKIGLLAGQLDHTTLSRLKSAVAGLKDPSGDPKLDEVLAEIELRVEVELAKLETIPES